MKNSIIIILAILVAIFSLKCADFNTSKPTFFNVISALTFIFDIVFLLGYLLTEIKD